MRGGRLIRRVFWALGLFVAFFSGCLFLTPMGRAARASVKAENLYAEHDLDGAEAQSRAALKEDPENSTAHFVLGRVLVDRGRADEAAAEYRLSLGRDAKNAAVHLALARALAVDDRDLDGARAASLRALELEPADGDVKRMVAMIEERRAARKKEADMARAAEIVADADRACGFNAGSVGNVFIAPDFSSCSCDLQKAITNYGQALTLNGSSLVAYRHLGIVLLRAGEFGRAARIYAEAARLQPQEPHHRTNTAEALELSGDVAGAEMVLLVAAGIRQSAEPAVAPGDRLEVFERLGDLALRSGRRQAAREYYAMAAQVDVPSNDASANVRKLKASFDAQMLETSNYQKEPPKLNPGSCYRVFGNTIEY